MKKLLTFTLILTFLFTSVIHIPPGYAAETGNRGNQAQINASGKEKIKPADLKNKPSKQPAAAKREKDPASLPPADRSGEITLDSGAADDFIYGNSVLYTLLKKKGRLDLLGKTTEQISREWEPEQERRTSPLPRAKRQYDLPLIQPAAGTVPENGPAVPEGIPLLPDTSAPIIRKTPNKSANTENILEQLPADYKTHRYIIKYQSGQELNKIGQVLGDSLQTTRSARHKNTGLLITKGKIKPAELYNILQQSESLDDIDYIQPDYQLGISSTDTYFPLQWGLQNEETVGENNFHVDANIVPAWETAQGSGVLVAVVDTGMDTEHEDIGANIDPRGWNFVDDNASIHDPGDTSDEMHATNVAAIIGAVKDNNRGIAGAAPQVKILPLKVFSQGTAYTSDIIEAIHYAQEKGAQIVNCSWGMNGTNPALEEAMEESGLLFICAAGNSAKDIGQEIVSPASFELPNLISVGALNDTGNLCGFSNYGVNNVHIAAPGQDIVTAAPGNAYVVAGGASIAAAFVSAEAALLLSREPNLSSAELKERILGSADHLSSLRGKIRQAAKINTANALNGAYPDPDTLIDIPLEEGGEQPLPDGEFFQLYDATAEQKAWYNTLVGPSAAAGVKESKYSAWQNLEEIVSPQTGDLTLKQSDIHLPGRNGLDLEIGRLYQSNQSLYGERKIYGDGTTSYSEYSTYLLNRYALGTGWSFNFPSVQVEKDESRTELYYHTGAGPVYHVNMTADPADSNLEDYYKKDAVFDNDATFTQDGVTSQYAFKTADQTKRYFAADGRLLGIVDRFGNSITFTYTEKQVSNLAPNSDFTYSENQGIWTMGTGVSYDAATGKDDTNSLQFSRASSTTSSTYSRYIPVLPNTKYILSGFIKSDLSSGTAGLNYREYNQSYGQLSQGTAVNAANNGQWSELLLPSFTTSPSTKYIRIEFANTSAAGTSNLDKVRFDRAWPLISGITDSIGRQITFTYHDNLYGDTDGDNHIDVTVQDPALEESVTLAYNRGKAVISYNWGSWQEERRFFSLHQFDNQDPNGLITYSYEDKNEKFNYISKSTGSGQTNLRPVLKEMFLRNSKVAYTYGQTTKHLGDNGFYQTYRITSRQEQRELEDGTYDAAHPGYEQNYAYGGVYNSTHYDNETGFPGPSTLFENPAYLFTSTMTQSNGLQVEQTFKGKYEYRTTRARFSDSSGDKTVATTETYDTHFPGQPTKIKREEQNSQGANILYTGYTYNDWGGLESETRPLTQAQWDDAAVKKWYTITYGYDSLYKFLASTRYYQSPGKLLAEGTTYDSLGRITFTRNAKGESSEYFYEDALYPGNLTRTAVQLPGGKASAIIMDYDPDYQAYPAAITTNYSEEGIPKTATTYKTYEFLRGNLLTASDALGHITSYEYDSLGRLQKISYPAAADQNGDSYMVRENYIYDDAVISEDTVNKTAFCVTAQKTKQYGENDPVEFAKSLGYYDDHGNLLLVQNYDYERAGYANRSNYLNNYGQPVWSQDALGNRTDYQFDEWNRIATATDALGHQQIVEYDIFNRTKSTCFIPYGGTAENHYKEAYDQWGRLVSRQGFPDGSNGTNTVEETYEYDIIGNLLKFTDAKSNTTHFRYDALNRLTKVINALGEVTDYDYNRLGNLNLLKQYEGGKTFQTTKLYDERGLLTSQELPLGETTTYKYNENGLPVQITGPDGKTSSLDYDSWNRMKEKTITAGTENGAINYLYHPLGGIAKYRIWENGAEQETLTYDYFSTGQIKERKQNSNSTTFTYDLNGNQTSVTDPFGLTTSYTYDEVNRPETITVGGKTFQYEYYGDGMIKKLIYPNGLITDYIYDNINRLHTLVNKNGGTVLSQYVYVYDNNGNILNIEEIVEGDTKNYSYEYDALNRLVKINRPGGEVVNYQYDTRGNRTQSTGITVAEADFIPATLGYNVWDELDIFTNTATGDIYTYEYDAEGLRIKKTAPGGTTKYHYDLSGRVIAESNGSGSVTAQNIWGHKALARKIGADYYYYLYNGHGDVVQIINEAGNIVNNYTYDEWGNIRSKTENISNPLKYAGEYYDDESGLYYLRARYYDPVIARFITKDSYEGDISNPLSINNYTYCHNNPIIYIDPTGHYIDYALEAARMNIEQTGAWKDTVDQRLSDIGTSYFGTSDPDTVAGYLHTVDTRPTASSTVNGSSGSDDGVSSNPVQEVKKVIKNADIATVGGGANLPAGTLANGYSKDYYLTHPETWGVAAPDPVGNFIIDTFATAGFGFVANLVKSTVTKIGTAIVEEAAPILRMNLQLFAQQDRNMISQAANKLKMTPELRREFGDFVERYKDASSIPSNATLKWKELIQLGKDFLRGDY